MLSTSYILWNIFLGTLGLSYIMYAKNRKKLMPFLGGIVLVSIPYLTENTYLYFFALMAVLFSSYFISI